MSRVEIEYVKKNAEKNFISDLKRVIASACGCSGKNYKLKVSLHELIDYKLKDSYTYKYGHKTQDDFNNELFKLNVAVIDDIIDLTKAYWPFIDLTGIDLNWTAQQIIDVALAAYYNVSAITLDEMKKYCKNS